MNNHLLLTIGRCLIALLFLWSGADKIRLRTMTAGVMRAHGIPLVPIALPVTIVFEVVCGLLLFANLLVPVVTALLALFVIVASLTIPVRDMRTTGDPKERHLLHVVVAGNAGLVGGLLFILGATS